MSEIQNGRTQSIAEIDNVADNLRTPAFVRYVLGQSGFDAGEFSGDASRLIHKDGRSGGMGAPDDSPVPTNESPDDLLRRIDDLFKETAELDTKIVRPDVAAFVGKELLAAA